MDLSLVLDASDAASTSGFQKIKTFAKQFVDSFEIGNDKARVGIVSYSASPSVECRFNSFTGRTLSKQKVFDQIDKVKFKGGRGRVTNALQAAANDIYTTRNGMRDTSVNKVL